MYASTAAAVAKNTTKQQNRCLHSLIRENFRPHLRKNGASKTTRRAPPTSTNETARLLTQLQDTFLPSRPPGRGTNRLAL